MTRIARGASGRVPAGAAFVRADRHDADAYDAVADTEWDEVIELSYDIDFVTGALEALGDRAKHWTLVSSVAVCADRSSPEADEDSALLEAGDLGSYGQVKVEVERPVQVIDVRDVAAWMIDAG